MKKWANYIEEREDGRLIESAHGFLTYKIIENTCLVMDLFVDSKHRKTSEFLELGKKVEKRAKEANCTRMEAHVQTSAFNADSSLRAILAFRYRLFGALNGMVILEKEI